jgi:protein ImuB
MGAAVGMDSAHARALIRGHVLIAPHRPDQDADALRALAAWCNRFSPTVGLDSPDGLVLDLTGTQRLYRGEDRVLAMLQRAMRRLGLRARIAIAPTWSCAWAVARYGIAQRTAAARGEGGLSTGSSWMVPAGREREWLAPLPLESLRAQGPVVDALHELGICCVGDLMRLPRSSLPSRFGDELLLSLDRALGQAVEIIEPVRPQPPLRIERVFDGPTTQLEAVESCTHELLGHLSELLAQRERGVRRLEAFLHRTNRAAAVCVNITLCRPSRDVKHVWSLLRPHIERADMGEGVEGITLVAAKTGIIRHEQAIVGGRPEAARAEQAMGALADTLISRLGADSVLRMLPAESHAPEAAMRMVSVVRHEEAGEVRVCTSPRPSRLYERPEPANVMYLCPDGPVHALRWREESWSVVSCVGPERIAGRWWRSQPEDPARTRDYYRVNAAPPTGGPPRWLWLFSDWTTASWYVQGEWA